MSLIRKSLFCMILQPHHWVPETAAILACVIKCILHWMSYLLMQGALEMSLNNIPANSTQAAHRLFIDYLVYSDCSSILLEHKQTEKTRERQQMGGSKRAILKQVFFLHTSPKNDKMMPCLNFHSALSWLTNGLSRSLTPWWLLMHTLLFAII